MCDCTCMGNCDLLLCDITMMAIRFLVEKILDGRQLKKNFSFLIRCYIGFVFDSIEYGILTATAADSIDYGRFETIFIAYGIYLAVISLFCCCSMEIFIFIFVLVFKGISLWMALLIFTTTNNFEWEVVETYFTTIDSTADFFLAMVIFVSFVDICLNMIVLLLKFAYIICKVCMSSRKCEDELTELLCSPHDKACSKNCFERSSSVSPRLEQTSVNVNITVTSEIAIFTAL